MTATQELVLAALRAIGAEQGGFYGVVSFHFQNGRLSVIRREQTVMPEEFTQENNFTDGTRNLPCQ